MFYLFLQSTYETILMVVVSIMIGIVAGVPLAVLLSITGSGGLWECRWLNVAAGFLVNAARSIPYIILAFLLMPVTKILVGSTIGTAAAIIPLSLAAILLIARVVEDSLRSLPRGLMEVGLAMGATNKQIINKILLSEALPSIVSGVTLVTINIIGFSAMAGTVGGGGLGDLAIRHGYQRYDVGLIFLIVLVLILMVQGVQMLGDYMTKKLMK